MGSVWHLFGESTDLRHDRELGTAFKRWYPDMEVEEMPEAA
jgi:hypothetical protein